MKVFISYAHENYQYASNLSNALKKPGIEPWLDERKLEAGDLYDKVIENEIKSSHCLIALVSNYSLQPNRYVQKEWRLARDEKEIRFIPIRLEECTPPKEFQNTHWDDLFPTNKAAYYEGLKKLLRLLYRIKRDRIRRVAKFEETFSCFGPDNEGWDLSDWHLENDNHTGEGSQSIYTKASLNIGLLPQTVTKVASIPFNLNNATTLRYYRKLNLSVFFGTASFKVIIDDGTEHIIDEELHTENYAEDHWTEKKIILTRYSREEVILKFMIAVTSTMNYMTSAAVWVDDITIL